MKNYLIFPMKILNITQNYNGKTSHYPHSTGNVKDYPLDLAGVDSGRDWIYCPCDKMKIERIYGVGSKGVNTIWLTSTTKCDLADGTQDYITIVCTHPEDDDLKKLKVGQIFSRGDKMFREGGDGGYANHIHLAVGKGKIKGNGWVENNKGKWVLTTVNGAVKPETVFYIDNKFTTTIKKDGGLKFKKIPKEVKTKESKYTTGNYKVTGADVLSVRKGPGTIYPRIKFSGLTKSAQDRIVKLAGYKANGYVKGLTFTVTQVKGDWGKTPSGWVNLKYCKKI